jgi:ABC-type transporter Mla maintaining outer membrane lipid asymmetry permease subunit MlaE
MRVTEELDAIKAWYRGARLVMPRALALALVMPLPSGRPWPFLFAALAADLVMG